ncbi:hypothetical protein [Ferrimonas marina]|uniref:Uncharacterized protein n=1 Tax=Ferrimonas marina TaxID=299255 RepID=A0A1M5R2X7_9GAMM|nr:hypothetical protein [Ferrimonas marina]SHH20724.1 hypothetical protein SAMN02745129_1465 [Ferrimonas marina]
MSRNWFYAAQPYLEILLCCYLLLFAGQKAATAVHHFKLQHSPTSVSAQEDVATLVTGWLDPRLTALFNSLSQADDKAVP